MPLLQEIDCPEDLYRKISSYAKNENRTIVQQVLIILEQGLKSGLMNKVRRKELLERINQRPIPKEVLGIDDAALIREDRNR